MVSKELIIKRVSGVVIAFAVAISVPLLTQAAGGYSEDFETASLGDIHMFDGWSSSGAAGSGCAVYDHAVAAHGFVPFGTQSLRMSNAVTSGCFGDHTFSKSLTDEAGETSAESDGMSGGNRETTFIAEWDFISVTPEAEQPGLSVVASPDRGDGARMSWVQMADTPTGIQINFNDFQMGTFVQTAIATSLNRSVVHNIRIEMEFVDGPANDIVKVYVDDVLAHTGTSWEDYFRTVELNETRTVDSILFRTGGAAAPATLGKGFYIDNLNLTSSTPVELVGPPTDKDQCKKDGWKLFNNPVFKNQGECVSSVVSKRGGHSLFSFLRGLF